MPGFVLRAAALTATAALAAAAPAAADTPRALHEVRSIPTADLGVPRPTSLAFSSDARTLLVGQQRRKRTVLRRLSLAEQRRGSVVLPALQNPTSLAYHPLRKRLMAVRRDGLVIAGASGVKRIRRLDLRTPRGIAYDGERHVLYVLDARARSVVRVPMRGRATRISLRRLGDRALRGVAFNPADDRLYVLTAGALVVVDGKGRVLRTISLAAADIARAQAAVFAPTGDPTDDPAATSLYLADSGDAQADGRIVELRYALTAAETAVVPTVVKPTLVRTNHTSSYAPPSPDPSGIVYLAGQDRFLIADSEVEEMSIYQGRNLFLGTRTGGGTGYGTTYAFSREPTGLGLNPADGTLFVSDDDRDQIFMLRPGADGLYATADDPRTQFATLPFGSGDAEGIEYDPASGHLFICDGVGLEMYDVDPVDGVFGNGNDSVTHFDVAQYSMRDCEGLGIDTSRGTLLAVDPSRRWILELTRSGQLVRTLDLSGLPINNWAHAGVTMAPTSDPTDDPAAMNYWVVDRQVDNGYDPNENDGKLYELSLGAAPPPPADSPPTVSVTQPTAGSNLSGTVLVAANAADDKGVTQVAFFVDGAQIGVDGNGADGWSLPWNTLTATNGAHTLGAMATDTAGNKTSSGTVPVNVSNAASTTVALPVRAGVDDGDETTDGAVRRTNGDLEIGKEQTGVRTTVGLRFAGVPIPRGARVEQAYVQFVADEKGRDTSLITLRGEATDNAAAFTSAAFNITARPDTAAAVSWSPPAWTVFGAAGLAERTPDLSALVQEIVNRPGWTSGHALVLTASGSGRRTAESFEGGAAPVLHVRYAT